MGARTKSATHVWKSVSFSIALRAHPITAVGMKEQACCKFLGRLLSSCLPVGACSTSGMGCVDKEEVRVRQLAVLLNSNASVVLLQHGCDGLEQLARVHLGNNLAYAWPVLSFQALQHLRSSSAVLNLR